MASFIAVPSEVLEKWLTDKKFTRSVQRDEVVYTRTSSRHHSVLLKVYTSIGVGRKTVRGAGRDAIRICVVFQNEMKSFGIGKFPAVPRVHSVDSVLRRTNERLLAAAKRANEWIDQDNARLAARVNADDWIVQKNRAAQFEREQEEAAYTAEMAEEIAWGEAMMGEEPPDSYRD